MDRHPFSSSESFRQAFSAGLSELLQDGGLGPFILVCANATFNPEIYAATAAGLETLTRDQLSGSALDIFLFSFRYW